MKTKIIVSLIVIGIVSTYVFVRFNVIWTGERIDLKELGTIKLAPGTDEHHNFNDQDWLIITSEDQRLNWKDSGYNLPVVNFKETFIVLSNHKIKNFTKRIVVIHVPEFQMVSLFMTFLIQTKAHITSIRFQQFGYHKVLDRIATAFQKRHC